MMGLISNNDRQSVELTHLLHGYWLINQSIWTYIRRNTVAWYSDWPIRITYFKELHNCGVLSSQFFSWFNHCSLVSKLVYPWACSSACFLRWWLLHKGSADLFPAGFRTNAHVQMAEGRSFIRGFEQQYTWTARKHFSPRNNTNTELLPWRLQLHAQITIPLHIPLCLISQFSPDHIYRPGGTYRHTHLYIHAHKESVLEFTCKLDYSSESLVPTVWASLWRWSSGKDLGIYILD